MASSSQSEPATQPFSSTSAPGDANKTELDVVTQLQTCIQQLTLQFYASINYIATRHPLSAPVDPLASRHILGASTNVASGTNGHGSASSNVAPTTSTTSSGPVRPPHPDPAVNPVTGQAPEGEGERDKAPLDPLHMPEPADSFQASLQELAQDLVTKTRQIEELAGRLPSLELEEGEEGEEGDQTEGRSRIGKEEKRQNERIEELTGELAQLSSRVKDARERRERAKRRIEKVVEVWASSQMVG